MTATLERIFMSAHQMSGGQQDNRAESAIVLEISRAGMRRQGYATETDATSGGATTNDASPLTQVLLVTPEATYDLAIPEVTPDVEMSYEDAVARGRALLGSQPSDLIDIDLGPAV